MSYSRFVTRLALVVFLISQLSLFTGLKQITPDLNAPHQTQQGQTNLESLPLPVQYALSRDLGQDNRDYHFTQHGESFLAASPGSGLSATLDSSGLQVRSGEHTWSLALSAWGRGQARDPLPAAATAKINANRLSYQRGPLSEWFLNGPLGLQQGWHIAEPPAGSSDQPVTLALALGGDLRAVVRSDRRSLALVDSAGFSALTYGGLLAYDDAGQELPAWFETQDERLLVRVADAGAVYPITVDPWLQAAKLTTSKPQDFDQLGFSVAISADGSTVVAGAPRRAPNDSPGRVYVYERPGEWATTHLYTAKLTASDGNADDELGRSVDISADGSLIVAGADNNDGDGAVGSLRGAVYLFTRPSGGWVDSTETAKLTAHDAADGDSLGISVAISDDGGTLVAGALGVDGPIGTNRGAAYVFERPPEGWSTTSAFSAKLTASDAADNDYLGWPVAISGDGETIAATAYGYSSSQGAVYLYELPSGGWESDTENAKLTASDIANGDHLGWSLALNGAGDVLVAGSMDADGAYVYVRSAASWSSAIETAKLTASDGTSGDGLGWSVAVDQAGDTVSVGAIYYEDNNATQTDRGAVYLYERPSTGWASTGAYNARLTASDTLDDDFLGNAVAVSADGTTLVTGASHQDGGGIDRGALYVYESPTLGWSPTASWDAKLTVGENGSHEYAGTSIALDADGRTVVVAAPGYPNNNFRGTAYIYERPGLDWEISAVFSARLTASDGQNHDDFGRSIAVSADGKTVVVGAPTDALSTNQGAVYVYERPVGGWGTTSAFSAKLTDIDGAADDRFGHSVATSSAGDTIAAGADLYAADDQGAVYLFERPTTGWATTDTYTALLTAAHPEDNDNMGSSIAISADGSTLVAGVPNQDAGGQDWGAVYLYQRPFDGWASSSAYDAKLTASDGEDDDKLGLRVAISTDGGTIAAGVPYRSASDQGAVYVFTRPTSGWADSTETAALSSGSDGTAGDLFGLSIALNSDGSQLAAGAPDHNLAGDDRGAVYLFQRKASGWASTSAYDAKLTANDGQDVDWLGSSVAISADGSTVAAGASGWNSIGANMGAAYLFVHIAAPEFTSPAPPSPVAVNQPYTHTFTTKNFPAAAFAVTSGALPDGLTLDGDTGLLSGTPTATGEYSFTVTASNGEEPDATQDATILVGTPPAFTSSAPTSPTTVGQTYTHTFTASGFPPPSFSVTSGSPPPGLSLDSTSGLLSVTPTTSGNYSFTVTASNGIEPDATQAVTIQVQQGDYLYLLPFLLNDE